MLSLQQGHLLQKVLSGTILIPSLNGARLPSAALRLAGRSASSCRAEAAVQCRQAMPDHGHGTEMTREVKRRSLQGSVANSVHAFVCPLNYSPPASFWDQSYVCW